MIHYNINVSASQSNLIKNALLWFIHKVAKCFVNV